jgi:chromosome segregation ATPase
MQVKEYVQALVDDGKLRVEKIGSGNWYWCFGSEERKEKEQVLAVLRTERDKLDKSTSELEEKIEMAKASREEDGEVGERDELMARLKNLEEEVGGLKKEEEAFKSAGVGGVERMRDDIARWKVEAEVWTDDLGTLEEYLEKITGGDRESVTGFKRQVYDAVPGEWTEEDGLRELGV